MLTTVTLWTLLVWAEPRRSVEALATVQVPGFASREACMTALGQLRDRNALLVSSSRPHNSSETGIDIKLMMCIPVESLQNPG